MKLSRGCAICGATWGNHWADVEGQRMFFCCSVCEVEFQNMIAEIKRRTGWKTIDEIEIVGDSRLRECKATLDNRTFEFSIGFNSEGGVRIFNEKPARQ